MGVKWAMKNIFLLDMDDTLLDFPRAERTALTATLSAFGVPVCDEVVARYHRINAELWQALERGEIAREKLKEQRFVMLFEEFGFSADAAGAARAYYSNMEECCFPYEGVYDFLKALKRAGRVYVCTNGGRNTQYRHIELAGFAPYFDGVFISEEAGADKPSRAYADHVLRRIPGFSRENAVYLGDSLTSDKKCAEVMGVDFVLFAPRGVPADYQGAAATTYGEALSFMLR